MGGPKPIWPPPTKTLLRPNPPKGGDAELGDYGGQRSPGQPGRQRLEKALSPWRSFVLGVDTPYFGRIAPLSRGSAPKANPAKAGDAKPRGYRTPSRAMPVELPNLTLIGRGYVLANQVPLGRRDGAGAPRGKRARAAHDRSDVWRGRTDRRQA